MSKTNEFFWIQQKYKCRARQDQAYIYVGITGFRESDTLPWFHVSALVKFGLKVNNGAKWIQNFS